MRKNILNLDRSKWNADFIKNKKKLFFLTGVVAFVGGLLLISFILFDNFEKIGFRSIARSHNEFSQKMDSMNTTINRFINDYGMQLYYSPAVQSLMNERSISSTTARSYRMREINGFLSASDFAENVYILNDHNQHVYSTDSRYSDITIDKMEVCPIKNFFLLRKKEDRFKPMLCKSNQAYGEDQYAFIFYELKQNKYPSPGVMVLTVKRSRFIQALFAAEPDTEIMVFDDKRNLIMTSSEEEEDDAHEFLSSEEGSDFEKKFKEGYYIDNKKELIYFYAKAKNSNLHYIKKAAISEVFPEVLQVRSLFFIFAFLCLGALLSLLTGTAVYVIGPMLSMKHALKTIKENQARNSYSTEVKEGFKEEIKAVLIQSERESLGQLLYDMIVKNIPSNEKELFKNEEENTKKIRLLLIKDKHRREIYKVADEKGKDVIIAKFINNYAVLGRFETEEELSEFAKNLSEELRTRIYISEEISNFFNLEVHFKNLIELSELSFLFSEEDRLIGEKSLNDRPKTSPVEVNDYTTLGMMLKAANLDGATERLDLLLEKLREGRADVIREFLIKMKQLTEKLMEGKEQELAVIPERPAEIESPEHLKNAIQSRFTEICSYYRDKKNEKYEKLADAVKNYIGEHLTEDNLNSQSIAEYFRMNTSYLGRQFKATHGTSVSDFINHSRLEMAKMLLKQGGDTIDEISVKVGISNRKYFYVLFKKMTGVTPAEYRKSGEEPEKTYS